MSLVQVFKVKHDHTTYPHMEKVKTTVDSVVQSGVAARFVRINQRKGIKTFKSQAECNSAMRRQKKAHKHKLGPKVLSVKSQKFAIQNGNELVIQWGYETQYAQQIDYMESTRAIDDQCDELQRQLGKIGLSTSDMHTGNVGYIGKNMVCIDFGDESYDY